MCVFQILVKTTNIAYTYLIQFTSLKLITGYVYTLRSTKSIHVVNVCNMLTNCICIEYMI